MEATNTYKKVKGDASCQEQPKPVHSLDSEDKTSLRELKKSVTDVIACENISLVSSSGSDISTRPYACGSIASNSTANADYIESWFESEGDEELVTPSESTSESNQDLETTMIEAELPSIDRYYPHQAQGNWPTNHRLGDIATSTITDDDSPDESRCLNSSYKSRSGSGLSPFCLSSPCSSRPSKQLSETTSPAAAKLLPAEKPRTISPRLPPPENTSKNTHMNNTHTPAKEIKTEATCVRGEIYNKTKTDNSELTFTDTKSHSNTLSKERLQQHRQAITEIQRQAVQNAQMHKVKLNTNNTTKQYNKKISPATAEIIINKNKDKPPNDKVDTNIINKNKDKSPNDKFDTNINEYQLFNKQMQNTPILPSPIIIARKKISPATAEIIINKNKDKLPNDKVETNINEYQLLNKQMQNIPTLPSPIIIARSKKCLLPLLTQNKISDNEQALQAVQTRTPNEYANVSDWISRVPPLLPEDLSLLPPTPVKAVVRIRDDPMAVATTTKDAQKQQQQHHISSPLKRRRRPSSDHCENDDNVSDSVDDINNADELIHSASFLKTPIYKSKLASDLQEDAKRRKLKLKDDSGNKANTNPHGTGTSKTQANRDCNNDDVMITDNNISSNSTSSSNNTSNQINKNKSNTSLGRIAVNTTTKILQTTQGNADDGMDVVENLTALSNNNNHNNSNAPPATPPVVQQSVITQQQQCSQHVQQQRCLPKQQLQQTFKQKPFVRNSNSSKNIPAIYLPMLPDIMPLLNKLSSNPQVGKFTTKITDSNSLCVLSANMETHKAIQAVMEEDDTPLFTHQAKENKGLKVVIRKLHNSTPCSVIKKELKTLGFNITFIRVKKSWHTRELLHMFELVVEPTTGDTHLDILKVKTLVNQVVKVELQRRANEPAQCHRCQAYGHTKNYCRRPFRCVKCAGEHQSTTCNKPKQDKPKCCNCKEDHVSSYKGCIKYKMACVEMFANRVKRGDTNRRRQQDQHQKQPHWQRSQQRQSQQLPEKRNTHFTQHQHQQQKQQQHHQQHLYQHQQHYQKPYQHQQQHNKRALSQQSWVTIADKSSTASYSWIVSNGNGAPSNKREDSNNTARTRQLQQLHLQQNPNPQRDLQQKHLQQQQQQPHQHQQHTDSTPVQKKEKKQHQQHRQEKQNKRQTSSGNEQQQQKRQQQRHQLQPAPNTPKPIFASATGRATHKASPMSIRPANALGPAGKYLADLQQKLQEKQRQQQQYERQQHVYQQQHIVQQNIRHTHEQPATTPASVPTATALPLTKDAIELNDQFYTRLEMKLDKLLDVLTHILSNKVDMSLIQNPIVCTAASQSSVHTATANDTNNV